MRKATVTIILTEEQDEALDREARQRAESRSSVVRELIREHLKPRPQERSSMPKVRS
jgi:metal-responsive CopG/Arc/MetJ family transcriptional regulator